MNDSPINPNNEVNAAQAVVNNIKTKHSHKKLILIIIAIVSVVLIAAGTTGVLLLVRGNNSSSKKTDDSSQTKVQTATDIKNEAVKLIHSDPAQAKKLLEEALAKYKSDGDINGVTDVNGLLFLVDHQTSK